MARVWRNTRRSLPDSITKDPDRNDGTLAITQFAAWIANADTKSGFLSTGLTALSAVVTSRIRQAIHSFPVEGTREWVAVILLGISTILVLISALNLISALTPRTPAPKSFTRYAFPALASKPEGFVPDLNFDQQRNESWTQARALSIIALAKFKHFRRGLHSFCGAILAVGTSFIVSPY